MRGLTGKSGQTTDTGTTAAQTEDAGASDEGAQEASAAAADTEQTEDEIRFELKEWYYLDQDETNAHNSGDYKDAFGSDGFELNFNSEYYLLQLGSSYSSGTWEQDGDGIRLTDSATQQVIAVTLFPEESMLAFDYQKDDIQWKIYMHGPTKGDNVRVLHLSGDAQNTGETQTQENTGTQVTFADLQMQYCVLKTAGYSEHDTLTEEICQSITELDTSEYALTTLEDLEYLPNLETLTVDNQKNESSLSLKGINKATKLKKLTLKNCGLSEVDRIAELTDLEYLDISSSHATTVEDYSSLVSLQKLKYLDMSWTGYNAYNGYHRKDGSFLEQLTALEELNLYETGIENYSLATLPNLKRLTISRIDTDATLAELAQSGALAQMESLCITDSDDFHEEMTDAGLSYLSAAVNLKELEVGVQSLTTLEGLGNLQNLKKLTLNGYSGLSDLPSSAYQEVSKLTGLEELVWSININSGEEAGADGYAFLSALTHLKTLQIWPYDGMSVSCLTALDELETLILNGSFGSWDVTVDFVDIGELKSLTLLRYCNAVSFKSTAPFDDLDYLAVEKIPLAAW